MISRFPFCNYLAFTIFHGSNKYQYQKGITYLSERVQCAALKPYPSVLIYIKPHHHWNHHLILYLFSLYVEPKIRRE